MADKTLHTTVHPFVKYFRYAGSPDMMEGQQFSTVWTGDVIVGRIIEVENPSVASILGGHPEWEAVSATAYNAQTKADLKEQANEKS